MNPSFLSSSVNALLNFETSFIIISFNCIELVNAFTSTIGILNAIPFGGHILALVSYDKFNL